MQRSLNWRKAQVSMSAWVGRTFKHHRNVRFDPISIHTLTLFA
jgi:hypothetical protein